MSVAKILDGNKLAKRRMLLLQQELAEWYAAGGRKPGLAVILVGDDDASLIYTERKRACCEKLGFNSFYHHLPGDVAAQEVIALIKCLNVDDAVDGILVQLPLPAHWPLEEVLETIDPIKDVDGFHASNLGRRVWGWPATVACTPLGIMHLLSETGVKLAGINALLIGASNIVGKPLMLELLRQGATVTVAHKFTIGLESLVRSAELVVVAAGVKHLVKGSWIREGAIVVDVGINREEDGSICGDVEFDTALERASWITPVPGGVGPMTVQCLMENSWAACQKREQIKKQADNLKSR